MTRIKINSCSGSNDGNGREEQQWQPQQCQSKRRRTLIPSTAKMSETDPTVVPSSWRESLFSHLSISSAKSFGGRKRRRSAFALAHWTTAKKARSTFVDASIRVYCYRDSGNFSFNCCVQRESDRKILVFLRTANGGRFLFPCGARSITRLSSRPPWANKTWLKNKKIFILNTSTLWFTEASHNCLRCWFQHRSSARSTHYVPLLLITSFPLWHERKAFRSCGGSAILNRPFGDKSCVTRSRAAGNDRIGICTDKAARRVSVAFPSDGSFSAQGVKASRAPERGVRGSVWVRCCAGCSTSRGRGERERVGEVSRLIPLMGG